MCSYVTTSAEISGSAKGPKGWFRATQATVYFDHPYHSPDAHTLNIDVTNPGDPSQRVALELTRESAEQLMAAIRSTLAQAEF
jgi:hypothetical protein